MTVLHHHRPATRALAPFAAAALLLLGACSSDGSDAKAATTTEAAPAGSTTTAAGPTDSTTTTAAPASEPLKILVSNDDGYSAEGISTLVDGLQTLDDVEVTVVAPLDQRSGTGGKTTEGTLAVSDVELKSGFAAKAVDGFPADTIRAAYDDLGLDPDLVITGINEGQNLGPLVNASGTVGAARAAVARGVPALATSSGLGQPVDYDAAVPFVLDWVKQHREAIEAGDEPAAVTNLNVPSCATGEVRDLVETETDLDGKAGDALKGTQDCSGTDPADEAAGDITEFTAGFATLSPVSANP
ncbi:hypothetical protein KSP35_04860 [Aquihabitans sp. G128]|uniref:5'/3'-nucleotidase SurE n=1 Tax=Aquihabitans sp. G128 TaxID=2849779 RepID=UPI001C235F07|nr:5'/3'-nucleotidase SurE [Aquihabitans sp. G128]QXC62144.1 hypothetical protein KSP35_04860 [Aquihabitans sp. G128]